MPVMSGLALQETLNARGVDIPIIFITGHGDVSTSVQAMKAHAFDFIEKPFNDQDLLDRIYAAIEQDARTRGKRVRNAELAERIALLTPREREIMEMIVAGKATKAIAIDLDISEKTVQTHRARIMAKMQVPSLAVLIRTVLESRFERSEPPSSES
jgi:FixJ family two-component response regulator